MTYSAFDTELAQRLLLQQQLPYSLNYRASTHSTNDDALGAAHGPGHHRSIFIADEQTQGRGRDGRSWLSEPGSGLTFSVLFRPGWEARKTSGFALAVGLAVRTALAKWTTVAPKIKWPNDVLVSGKKIAGTLVETQIRGGSLGSLVVGIGVNINATSFPAEIDLIATSLQLSHGASVARELVLVELVAQLDQRYLEFAKSGVPGLLTDLTTFDALFGERIEVGHLVGTAAGISPEGALRLRLDSGVERLIQSGTVSRVG